MQSDVTEKRFRRWTLYNSKRSELFGIKSLVGNTI